MAETHAKLTEKCSILRKISAVVSTSAFKNCRNYDNSIVVVLFRLQWHKKSIELNSYECCCFV